MRMNTGHIGAVVRKEVRDYRRSRSVVGTMTVLPLIFLVETGWYAVVAAVFSAGGARAAYLGAKAWIDRSAGAVLGALGLRLIFETGRPG